VIPQDGEKVTVEGREFTWHAVDTEDYNVNLYHFAHDLGKPTSNVLFWAVIKGGGATDFYARLLDAENRPLTGFTVGVVNAEK
jgi:hypothetical protein